MKSDVGNLKSEVVQPILLFASDVEGLGNLAALASIAYKGWPCREQAITWDEMASRAGGLLAVLLAADQAGRAPLGSVLLKRLSELGAELHEAFGGMTFMGLPAPLPGDDTLTRQAQATANYLG